MSEQITVTGLVATDVRRHETADGLVVASFRLAASTRRFDQSKNSWATTSTNWFTVASFRQLAQNVFDSINKGDRILVTGKLKIRDWDNGERSGTSVEIEADHIGFDLSFGTSTFDRVVIRDNEDDEELEEELQPA